MSANEALIFHDFVSKELDQFHACREKYIAMEAAREVIKGMVNDENNPNNERPTSHQNDNSTHFDQKSKELVEEVFELQNALSKKEFLKEKLRLLDIEMEDITKETSDDDILNLEAEIEQTEILLQSNLRKNEDLDDQIAEHEAMRERAEIEVRLVEDNAKSGIIPQVISVDDATQPSMMDVENSLPALKTKGELERFQKQKLNLLALTNGLESLLQLKLDAVEATQENGVLLTITIDHRHKFGFELDDKRKLVDIQIDKSNAGGDCATATATLIDPLRLLCNCAPLAPPLDLRHALVYISASLRRDAAINLHLKGGIFDRNHPNSVHKFCLLHRDKSDPSRVDVTFRNGISAVLKIHDSYPNVPNGVHIDTMTSVGGWNEEELRTVRSSLNTECIQTIPKMVLKILDAFRAED